MILFLDEERAYLSWVTHHRSGFVLESRQARSGKWVECKPHGHVSNQNFYYHNSAMIRLGDILDKALDFLSAPARWVMCRLPSNEYEDCRNVTSSSETALQLARLALTTYPTLLSEVVEAPESSSVTAVVGSGAFNLNPTHLTIVVIRLTDSTSRLHILGKAKEGLIKQRSAEKAVKRVVAVMFESIG